MPEITVEKAEYDRRQQAWELLDSMLKNPKTRAKAREAIKGIKPDVSFPEDIADPLLKPLIERLDAIEKERKDDKENAAQSDLKKRIDALKKNHGFTDEGIDEVVKLMKERNIGDPEVAAVYIKAQSPAPVQVQGLQPSGWQIEQQARADENVKALFSDPESWADNEAAKVITELRSGKAA